MKATVVQSYDHGLFAMWTRILAGRQVIDNVRSYSYRSFAVDWFHAQHFPVVKRHAKHVPILTHDATFPFIKTAIWSSDSSDVGVAAIARSNP